MIPPAIIHPFWLQQFAPFFTETITIEVGTETTDEYGDVHTDWATLPGHANLHAAIASMHGGENKGTPMTVMIGEYRVHLHGYFPTITEKHRLVWRGRYLDILGVYHAPNNAFSVITARVVV